MSSSQGTPKPASDAGSAANSPQLSPPARPRPLDGEPQRLADKPLGEVLLEQKRAVWKLWQAWAELGSRQRKRSAAWPAEDGAERAKRGKEQEATMLPLGGFLVSAENLQRHLTEVGSSMSRYKAALTLMHRKLYEHRMNKGIFNVPVDPEALRIPTYFDVIKRPMDLGTIKARLEGEEYASPEAFAEDVRLVFSNATTFNNAKTYVHKAAKACSKIFESEYAKFDKERARDAEAQAAHSCASCKGEACELCGRKCLYFQEPVLRCSVPCKARIQRNATYYRLGGDRGQHWCNKCYSALPDNFTGILGQAVRKADLERCSNTEVFHEPWVDCAHCGRRVHQICALYHPSIVAEGGDQSAAPDFVCPVCVGHSRGVQLSLPHLRPRAADEGAAAARLHVPSAAEHSRAGALPHTEMGRYMEHCVREVVRRAASPDVAQSLTLRVVSSLDCVTRYEPRIMRWLEAQRRSCNAAYTGESLASEFPCRTKTVLLFQEIDGVDVIVFVLYVQEYGKDCPPPNHRKVYISYLDSVAYLKPANLRTGVYQELLVSYITWVSARGFQHVYIWACPPQRGDPYIIYCHPKWQRTPGAERLRKWYAGIVQACLRNGSVVSETNQYEHHMSRFPPLLNTRSSRGGPKRAELRVETAPPASTRIEYPFELIPYFYGDYIPNEIEALLTSLLNSHANTHSSCDEAIRVWWRAVWGPQTRATLVQSALPAIPASRPSTPATSAASAEGRDAEAASSGAGAGRSPVQTPAKAAVWKLQPSADLDQCDLSAGLLTPQQRNDWLMRRLAATVKPLSDNFMVLHLAHSAAPPAGHGAAEAGKGHEQHQQEQAAEQAAEDGDSAQVVRLNGTVLSADTSDPDPALPKGIFDTRLVFLDMCKHNHFQFDELRRAKHSSVVLLHHHQSALQEALAPDAAAQPPAQPRFAG